MASQLKGAPAPAANGSYANGYAPTATDLNNHAYETYVKRQDVDMGGNTIAGANLISGRRLSLSGASVGLVGNVDTAEVSLTSGASVALSSLIGGSNGLLFITSTTDGTVFGCVAIRGGISNVVECFDAMNTISTVDAGVQVCVLASGGSYTLKNRLATTQIITLAFFGQ